MVKDAGNRLNRATRVGLSGDRKTLQEQLGGRDRVDFYKVRLGSHSSMTADLSTAGGAAKLHLFEDRNNNGRIDRGERVARSRRSDGGESLTASNLTKGGTFYLRVKPKSSGTFDYQLTLAEGDVSFGVAAVDRGSGRRSGSNRWNASFLNRGRSDLRDYARYNFDRADANLDLGDRGTSGRTVARLDANFGRKAPAAGIGKNRFAMEAWTSVQLQEGEFYRVTTDSDDGTRFFFSNAETGKVMAELAGDWRNRRTSSPTWSQVVTAAQSGDVNFHVQYFENRGTSVIDVALEEIDLLGQVRASALNVRNTPSTLNNTPIDTLDSGEVFTITRQVKSSNDSTYRNWYEIVTQEGTKGYISANDSFVNILSDATVPDIVSVGTESIVQPPIPPDTGTPPGGDTGGTPIPPPAGFTRGVISSKVWITSDDKISFRSNKDISGAELGRLAAGTPLTLLGKETGGRYLNGFDEWYRIRVDVGGGSQEGYVAAYYVDVLDDGGLYETAISKENSLYKPHLNELLNPTYHFQSYRPFVESAASRYSWLQPSVIAGIGSRESAWGRLLSPAGPGGTGDGGHGRGLMQVDDRFHVDFINTGLWRDPKANIDYGIDKVLAPNYNYLDRNTNLDGIELLRGAIASYNSGLGNVTRAISQGLDVDYYTTGQDYSWDVLNRAGWFQSHGWA